MKRYNRSGNHPTCPCSCPINNWNHILRTWSLRQEVLHRTFACNWMPSNKIQMESHFHIGWPYATAVCLHLWAALLTMIRMAKRPSTKKTQCPLQIRFDGDKMSKNVLSNLCWWLFLLSLRVLESKNHLQKESMHDKHPYLPQQMMASSLWHHRKSPNTWAGPVMCSANQSPAASGHLHHFLRSGQRFSTWHFLLHFEASRHATRLQAQGPHTRCLLLLLTAAYHHHFSCIAHYQTQSDLATLFLHIFSSPRDGST